MLTRLKNGVEEELSPDAEAAFRAEWAFEVGKPAPVPNATPLQLYDEMDETHSIDLEAEIGALSQKALLRFRLASEIKPTDQFAIALKAKLGWTNAQMAALFRAAAQR